jgi:tetratricopeptide (TPR) repeat protein
MMVVKSQKNLTMPYDLFISYSRKDNANNRVTELKNQIETDYLEFAKEPLNCFFDQKEIKGMDDWQLRLLQGLKDSHLLLVILSPNYLSSPYCEWEIVEYLKYEYSRGVAGDGVAQVYFIEIPGIDDEDFRVKTAAWLEKVSRRQRIDLLPWYDEGAASLQRLEVKKRLDELKESLHKRISRMRIISEAPGNLPAPNPRFVGREKEMAMIHAATALGKLGVVTAVHGVGGLGKTAIAFQYAYAYANFYPGGRWYLSCANETNLAGVIKKLDLDLEISFTEDEKKDDIRGAKRILNELHSKAIENAQKANQKPGLSPAEYVKPAVLIILDNVDHPEMVQQPQIDLISGKEWLKILVTTRLGENELGGDDTTQTFLTIDELPFDDALSLMESYQPGGRFKNEEEKGKAGEVVRFLGCFTLAVEVAALYLHEKAHVSCADFLQVLKTKGVDFAGENTKKQLTHTKLVSLTLAPTLDSLSPEETLILNYTALLPPDSIPLPWIKALVVKEYTHLGEEEMAGIDNPWITTVNHLLSLRLLHVADVEGQIPRLVRMHRLIGENVRKKEIDNLNTYRDNLTDYLKIRCNELEHTWHQFQWEIMPIIGYAKSLLEINAHKAAKLVRSLCQWLTAYDGGRYSEPLLRDTLKFLEEYPSDDYTDLSVTLSNLGWALIRQTKYAEAEKYLKEALTMDEENDPNDFHSLAVRYENLGDFMEGLGIYSTAKKYFEKGLQCFIKSVGEDNPYTTSARSNLALVLKALGELQEAKKLLQQALASDEKTFEPGHPSIAIKQSNLASVLQDLGELQEAKVLFRSSLEIRKQAYGPTHPATANGYVNLSRILADLEKWDEAESNARIAISIWQKTDNRNDPRLGKAFWTLGLVEAHRNNKPDAENNFLEALRLFRLGNGEDNAWIISVKSELENLHLK